MYNMNTFGNCLGPISGSGWRMPRKCVATVLDLSFSAWLAMDEIKSGMIAYYSAVGCGSAIRTATVVIRDDQVEVAEDFVPASMSRASEIIGSMKPKGHTLLGAAVRKALDRLDDQMAELRRCRYAMAVPELVVVTDGGATDDIAQVAHEVAARVRSGCLIVRMLAYGKADHVTLGTFGGDVAHIADAGAIATMLAEFGARSCADAVRSAVSDFGRQTVSAWDLRGAYVAVDGANVAGWATRRGEPRLATVLSVARELKARGVRYVVWFDANFLGSLNGADALLLHQLLDSRPETFKQAPASIDPRTGKPYKADVFVLNDCMAHPGSYYLSNDLYRTEARMMPQRYGWTQGQADRRICGMATDEFVYLEPIGWKIRIK